MSTTTNNILREYAATANNPEYKGDWNVIDSKFPELKDYDKQVLREYAATANNPEYKGDWNVVDSKFPELFENNSKITEGDKMRLGSFPVQAPTLNLEDKPAGQFYKPLPRQTSLYNPRLRENDMTGLTEEKTADARPALQKEFIAPTGESIKKGYGAQEAATAQSAEYLANPQEQAQAQWELLNSTPQKYGTPRKDQFGNESWDLTADDQEYMNSLFDQLPERQQVEEWKKNPEKWNDRPFIQQFRTVADSQKSIFGDNWLGDASLAAGNVVEALNAGGAAVGGGLSEFVHQNIEKPLFGWVSKDPTSRLAFGRLADVFFEDQAYSSSAAGKHNTIDENGNIRQKDFTDYIKEGDFASALGDLSLGALESAPTSAVQIGTSFVGAPQIGMAVVGAQVAGSRKRELDAMNPELSEMQKTLIAYGSGAIEAGSNFMSDIPIGKILGKLYKTGGTAVAENVMRNSVDGIIKATTKQLKNGSLLWKAPLMEGGEEFVSGVGNYLLDSANGLQQFNMSEMLSQSGKQMAYGAVAGGGFGLVGTPGLIRNAKVAKELETLKSQYDTANSNMQNAFADSEFEFEGEKIITLPLAQQQQILPAVYEAENLSDAQKTAIRDYMEAGNNLNAALVNVGLTNIELLRKKANAFKEVQESINDKTGKVDVITIQGTADTQQYNVKSGTVVLDNEGKVDTQNSDEAIYYYTGAMNEDGTPEVNIITPESISELTQLDPKEELKSRFTEIEAEEFVRSEFGAGMQIQVNSDAGLLPATVVAVTPTGLIANVQGQEVELSFAQAVEDVSPSTLLREQPSTGSGTNASAKVDGGDNGDGASASLSNQTTEELSAQYESLNAALESGALNEQQMKEASVAVQQIEAELATRANTTTSETYKPGETSAKGFRVRSIDSEGNYLIEDTAGNLVDRAAPEDMAEFGFEPIREGSIISATDNVDGGDIVDNASAPSTLLRDQDSTGSASAYPLLKDGTPDFDNMTVAQTYEYMVDNYGQEEANNGLSMQEKSIQALISQNIKALSKVNEQLYGQLRTAKTIQEQLKIREKNKATITKLTDERTALDTQLAEIRALMPQVEQAPAQPEVMAVKGSNVRPEEQLRREQEAKAQEENKMPKLSIEEKKADIERRRQEELNQKTSFKNTNHKLTNRYSINIASKFGFDGFDVDISSKNNNSTTGFIYNKALSQHFDTIEEAKLYASEIANRDKEYINDINAKYDAELAALEAASESKPVAETEQQPVIEVREKEEWKGTPQWTRRLINLGDAMTVEDVVLRRIAGGAKFVWTASAPLKGLAEELGFTNKPGERKLRKNLIDNENGMTPQEFAHVIYESGDLDFMPGVEYQDVYNAVVETLLQVNSATMAMEKAEANRNKYDMMQEDYDIYRGITPEEWAYLEEIPDEILAGYLGITNFSPEQIDFIFNIQNEYYANEQQQQTPANAEPTSASTSERSEAPESTTSSGTDKIEPTAEILAISEKLVNKQPLTTEEQSVYKNADNKRMFNEAVGRIIAAKDEEDEKKQQAKKKAKKSKPKTTTPQSQIQQVLDNYNDEGQNGNGTMQEVIENIVTVAYDNDITAIQEAYKTYQDELREDREEFGERGDREAIENNFMQVVNDYLNQSEQPLEKLTQAELDTQELDAYIAGQAHNSNPTEKQKETGIYDKARISLQGHNITLETLKNEQRSGVDSNGKAWSITMNNHYGELDGTTGYDGDAIDVFVGPNPKQGQIFVVDQVTPEGTFDESKVMLGFDTAEQAKAAYMSNYEEGWQGFGSITPAGDNFKQWLYDGKKQRKPFAEYKETPEALEKVDSNVDTSKANVDTPESIKTKLLSELTLPKYIYDFFNSLKQSESSDYIFAVYGKGFAPFNGRKINEFFSYVRNAINNNDKIAKEILQDKGFDISNVEKVDYTRIWFKNGIFLSKTTGEKNSNANYFYAGTQVSIRDTKEYREIADQSVDANEMIEKPVEATSAHKYKNGDTVYYQGKQYIVNGIYNGVLAYDLETSAGKLAFEEVEESELSKQAPAPRSILDVAVEQHKKNEEKAAQQPKEVDVAGIFNSLNKKGTAKLSENIVPDKVSAAQAEADAALADFLDAFNDLNSDNLGIVDNTAEKQAKMLVAGTKMVGAFTKLGVYKFAELVQQLQAKGIQITEDLLSAIKKAYGAFAAESDIDELDDMKTVRQFTLNNLQQKKNEDLTPKTDNLPKNDVSLTDNKFINEHVIFGTIPKTNDNDNSKQRVLQGSNKRISRATQPDLFSGVDSGEGTGGSIGTQSNAVSGADAAEQQPTGRTGSVLSGNVDVLTPALVPFNAEDNDTQSFNQSRKYDDNIAAIETLITLVKENRKATPDEKAILSNYVGFGGLKDIVLNPESAEGWKESNLKYRAQVKRINELAAEFDQVTGSTDSLAKIKGSILNAHFTSSSIIRSVYDGVQKLGFKSGRMLEPSAGIGNFITYAPERIKANSSITAVELDNLTGNILKYLHDDVNVKVSGIQDAQIPNNSQDLVISNVPFGNYKIFDKAFKGDKAEFQNRIHNYFFAKAVDMAREGGIIAFVTSKGVMDAQGNEALRKYLNDNTEFLGAVRLPNNAFKNNANTEVVTDIIFLKKNTTGTKNNPDFVSIKQVEATHKDGEKQMVNVNNYFVENPQNMLGNIVAGGLYSREDYTVENKTGYDLSKAIKNALPAGVYEKVNSKIGLQANDSQQTIDAIKEGNIEVTGGRVVRKEEGQLTDISINEPQGKIEHYIRLRNALMNLIYSEYLGRPDSELNAIRQQLNTEYDTFVKKHGKLSKNAIKIAKQDADGFNVLSLEVADKKDSKADIFRQRTIQPIQNKLTAESVDEAIVISLYENASIDVERIAELLNKTVPEVLQEAKGKIFEQPEGGFVTREEYLSGNVKAKLRQAQEAVDKGFSEFAYNVEQLMDVIPADIPAMHIEARLGSRWIPQEVYTEFAQHLFNTPSAKVIYQRSIDAYSNNGRIETVEAHSKWGTARRNGSDILLDALHINPPKIFDTIKEFGQEKRVLNQDETKKAVEKYEEIRAEFENWVYKAEERRTLLARIYNEKYNTTVKRSYNGDHLNIAGINGVELRPHQKDAIWMLLQNNGGIIDHLVGAGKTFVMVAGTMEMKRTGIAKKPMIIALKSTIPQIVETYRKAYPMAKILAPLEKDFTKDNRRKLFSQIANNEWDVIIMSHENYGKIPHEADIQRDFLRAEMQEIEDERGELEAAGEKQALKGLEIRLKNLEARLEKISDIDKDNSLTFEQMGIDHIMVDESQQFKNLSYVTKQRGVAGLSKAEGSKRAFNLFIGIRYLQQKYGADKGTTFLSGTPISNSMVEMYLLLKYLRPGKMAELGFNSFDAWATTFASPNSDIEFTVTGDFKSKTRFREFINVPELSMLYTEIADIRTDANTPLDKPKMKGGGYSVVEIKMSDDQIEYGQRLMEFARTKDGHHIGMTLTKNQETAAMLLATNLSSKMAIDMRLIDSSYDYDPNGKIAKLVDNVERIYNETSEHKGTQLIFSDLGTPKNKTNKTAGLRDYMEDEMGVNLDTLNEIFGNPDEAGYKYPSINSIREKLSGILELTDAEIDNIISESEQSEGAFNVYGEVRKRLVEKGIPEEQVVFIHDYNSQRAKEKLFKQVQNGEIRIVLGSTQKLGTGVNVQDRVVAVHHLDVPWTPASMEQRNGRAIRQGNWVAKNHYGNELPIYAYATERTLDAYKYQLLQTKQRFLDQVKSGDVEERTVRESDGDSESGVGYAELVAMLSGNTDILLKAKLETLVQKLTKSKRNYLSEIYEAQDKKQKLEERIPVIESNIAKTTENIETITNAVQYDAEAKMEVADINGETLVVKNDKGKVVPTERIDYGKRAAEIAKAKLDGASYGNIVKLFSQNGFDFYGSKRNEWVTNNGKSVETEKRYIVLRAKNGVEYNVTYSETPGVLLNNIQKAIQGIPAILTTQQSILDKANKDIVAYNEIISKGTEWEKEPELTKALNELKEVTKRLDDISTKDQPQPPTDGDAITDDKIRIGDLTFTIGKESFVTMAEAKNKAGEDVAAVRINSQLSNEDYTRRVKPTIGNYFGEWNSSNKVILFKSIKQAENFKITIENEFKKENREYEAPQLHTGTTMKPATPEEVAATVEQLLKTGLAKEVRMVTPEEIAGMMDGAETLLRTPSGTIYGFVKGGVVYLNSSTPNLNTPIHEFGHLWIDAIEGSDLYNRGAELVKETPYWERVNADPNYKDMSETARTKEAMAMAIGDKGEAVKRNIGLYARIKTWIADVWQRIGSQFGIQNLTPEQIQNLTFNDFVEVAVSELMSGEKLYNSKNSIFTEKNTMNKPLNYKFDNKNCSYFVRFSDHIDEDMKRGWSSWQFGANGFEGTKEELLSNLNWYKENKSEFEISGFNIWIDENSNIRQENGAIYLKTDFETFEIRELYPNYWVAVDNVNARGGLSAHELPNNITDITDALNEIQNKPYHYDGTGDGEVFDPFDEAKIIYSSEKGENRLQQYHIIEIGENKIKQEQEMPATIDVDGIQRPTTNSTGKPIHSTEEGIRNFWRWFGDSKVVDNEGRPLVVYHGTNADFNKFKPTKPNFYAITEGTYFFTDNENVAANFGKYVIPVYLNIDNPTELDGRSAGRFNTWELNDDSGNYGWIVKNSDTGGGITTEYAVENPTQIKSATGNNGGFDGSDPDIRYQVGPEKPEFTGDLGKFAQQTTEYNEAQAERTTRISKMQRLQEIMVDKSALAARHRNKEVSNQEYAKQMLALHEEKQRVMKGLPDPTPEDDGPDDTDPKPTRTPGQSITEYATAVADWNYRQTLAKALAGTSNDITGGLPPVDDDTDINGDMLRYELDQRLGGFFGRLVEGWQDNIRSVRIFLDLLREKGTRVSDYNNFYMQYTALQGKNDAHLKDFGKRFMTAINANVQNIQKYTNYEYRDVENYVFIKHGIERNEYMRAQAAAEAVNEKLPPLTKEQIEGDIDGSLQDEYKAAYDQFMEEETAKVADKDYSGLFAVAAEIWAKQNGEAFNPKKKGDVARIQKMDEFKADRDAVIAEYIAKFEKTISETIIPGHAKGEQLTIDGFWAAINAATNYSLDRLVSSGIESKEDVDDLKARYQYYVPLRGHEVEAEKRWQYEAPDNKNVVSKAIMQASGRGSRAEHPFAYIIQMAQTSINKANRNQLNQTILRLARLDKSGLMSVSETWYVLTGTDPDSGKEIWTETEPDFSEDHEIRAGEIRAWNEKMKKLEEEGKARRFKKGLSIGGLFIKPKQKRQHAITVFEDGVSYQVYINGNPRVSQAINELNGTKWNIPIITQTTRFISSMITSRSPQFMLTNGARDLAFASSILPSKEGARYTGQFLKNYPVAMAILANDATFDFGNDKARYKKYLKEFEMNGGETGYSHLLELQDIQKELYKKQKGKNYLNPLTDLDAIISVVDAGNKVIENSTRLATYITSRESGRSIERSVSDSKEVTLNFNRRGSGIMGAAHVSSIFMFVNAGVQALANFGHVYKMHPAKMSATIGAYVAVGFLMPMIINMIGGDGDEKEYMNMTDWERQTNLCLPTGSGFAKIPLPQEMRVFFKLGDEVYKLYSGRTEATETAMATLLSAADMIPISPLGTVAAGEINDFGDLQRAISPDALRGVAELATNTNFMGGQIYDKYKAEKAELPGYQKARLNRVGDPRAPESIVGFTKWLDHLTGGNGVKKGKPSWNPDIVNHLAKSYLGGMYSLIAEGEKSFTKRFYTSNADIEEKNTTVKDYYKRIREAEEVLRQDKGYWEQVEKGEISEDAYNKQIPPALLEKAYTIHDYGNTITKIERLLKTGDLTPDDELYYKHMSDSLKMEVIRIR